MNSKITLLGSLFLSLGLAFATALHAQSAAWSGDGTVDDGAWNWDEAVNWDGVNIPGTTSGISNSDTATFGTQDNRVVRVDNGRVIGNVSFGISPGSYTFLGETLGLSHGGTMTVGAGAFGTAGIDHTFENAIVLHPEDSNSDGSYTINDFVVNEHLYFEGHVSGGNTVGAITLNIGGSGGRARIRFNGGISDGDADGGVALNVATSASQNDFFGVVLGDNSYSGGTFLRRSGSFGSTLGGNVVITHDNAFGTGVLDIQVAGLHEEVTSAGESYTIANDVILRDNMRVGTVVLTWDGDFRLDPDEGNTVQYQGPGVFNNPITEANGPTHFQLIQSGGAFILNAAPTFTGNFIFNSTSAFALSSPVVLGPGANVGTGTIIVLPGRGGGFLANNSTITNDLVVDGALNTSGTGISSPHTLTYTGDATIGSVDSVSVSFETNSGWVSNVIFEGKLTDGGFDTPISFNRGNHSFYADNEISGTVSILRETVTIGNGGATGLIGTSPEVIMGGTSTLAGLTFNRTGTYEVGHDFVNAASNPGGRITFTGGGTAILTGDSTVSAHANSAGDNVMVVGSATTLLMEGSHTTTGNYLIQTGGTLGGSGSITASNISLASGAFLAPGGETTPGTLDLDAVVDLVLLNQSGQLIFRLGSVSDRVDNANTFLGFVVDELEFGDFDFIAVSGFGAGTYTLMTGKFTGDVLGSNTTGFINGFESELQFDGVDTLSLTVVPEPATVAAILGALALGLAFWRRRGMRLKARA